MFEWISSLALVIFEVICCVMFFESFCKEQENWKKWHKYVLIGIQTAEFFACGMFFITVDHYKTDCRCAYDSHKHVCLFWNQHTKVRYIICVVYKSGLGSRLSGIRRK